MYYSQYQEDVFLNDRYFKNKRNGTYIELGALDGIFYSNTKFFEDQFGWSGILIEPHPIICETLKNNRPNNFVFNDLVSCHQEELKFRYFVHCYAPVSGVENTLTEHHFKDYFDNECNRSLPQSSIMLKPRTLTDIVKSTNINHIDLLSLDVEVHEYEVLLSWDFSIPIDVILIEMLDKNSEKDELCRQHLIKNGYKFDCVCAHNEVFIRNDIFLEMQC